MPEIDHAPFIPNLLYIATYNRLVGNYQQTNLGMVFCAVTPTAGTYFIAQQRPADGKWILNMTSTYPADFFITGWYPISNRPVEYTETTTANGKVNGVRRDNTTEESWLWTARLLREFDVNSCIDWRSVIPVIGPRMPIMSDECRAHMMSTVPGLQDWLTRFGR